MTMTFNYERPQTARTRKIHLFLILGFDNPLVVVGFGIHEDGRLIDCGTFAIHRNGELTSYRMGGRWRELLRWPRLV